jgi:tetratricopeptide (TPR) repeat protein
LGAVPGQAHNALSLSYLAEAHLAACDATSAVANATTAIDELDSIHGRSFLVRARARRALGDIEGAARDYNKALAADDEPGVEESAMAGLEEIDRPVMSEEDWWEDEEGWEDDEDRPEPPLPGGDRGTP